MSPFEGFLSKYRSKKGENYNFVGMEKQKGRFLIPSGKMDLFFELYVQHVFEMNNTCDLIERHVSISSLLLDLDFKLKSGVTEHVYSEQFLVDFLTISARILRKYLNIPKDGFKAFILEKELKGKTTKDGIHIVFPYIVTYPSFQYLFREELLILAESLFDSLDLVNTIEDVLDESIIERNGRMLYGSSKPKSSPYLLTTIYDLSSFDGPSKCLSSGYFTNHLELTKLLSIRTYSIADLTPLNANANGILKSWEEEKKKQELKEIKVQNSDKNLSCINFYKNDLTSIKLLVEILSEERASNYNTWIEVGWCLYTIDYRLLDTWIEFSKRCDRYKDVAETECKIRWDSMRTVGLGVGSLHMWARKDNPEEYSNIIENSIEYHICKSVLHRIDKSEKSETNDMSSYMSETIYHIVMALKKKYGHSFVCSSYAKRNWFEFTNVRWVEDDDDVGLRRRIREELHRDFINTAIKYRALVEKYKGMDENNPNIGRYEKISNAIWNVSKNLRDSTFRRKISDEASEQLYWSREQSNMYDNASFEEILDTRTHLIGLQDGVYDLNLGQFREGRCEDFITLSTQLKWKVYQWTDKKVDEIRQFLCQVLPEEDTREYVMHTLASFLDGDIKEEHFHVWVGSGGNGKSKLIELFEYAFGKYCSKLSVSALTQKRTSSSAPTPEIARLKGKRFVVLQEPNEHERIQVGIMKEMTGGDKIIARSLNKEPIEFKPQFKMVLTCNQLPKVPADDGGTWRRIRVVKFTSSFVEKPNPENPNEFPLDSQLGEKLKKWGSPFFWMLTEYYKSYKKNGIKAPESVLLSTQEYQAMNDIYGDFVASQIEAVPKGVIYIDSIYTIFQIWYRKGYPDKKCPSRKDLFAYLQKRFGSYVHGKTQKKGWRNYKLHEVRDDSAVYQVEDDDDEI